MEAKFKALVNAKGGKVGFSDYQAYVFRFYALYSGCRLDAGSANYIIGRDSVGSVVALWSLQAGVGYIRIPGWKPSIERQCELHARINKRGQVEHVFSNALNLDLIMGDVRLNDWFMLQELKAGDFGQRRLLRGARRSGAILACKRLRYAELQLPAWLFGGIKDHDSMQAAFERELIA